MKKRRDVKERFMEKVSIGDKDQCWEWQGTKYSNNGYGVFVFNGKHVKAHRMSYLIHFGNIPDDKLILHKCDNKPCVNPNHLYVGTNKDNATDRENRNRGNHSSIAHEKSPLAKLTEKQVKKIRELNLERHINMKRIAKIFNISPSQVGNIVHFRQWK